MERKKAVKKCVFISHSLFYNFFRISGLPMAYIQRRQGPIGVVKFPAPCSLYHRGVRFLHSVETLHRVSKSAEVGL